MSMKMTSKNDSSGNEKGESTAVGGSTDGGESNSDSRGSYRESTKRKYLRAA